MISRTFQLSEGTPLHGCPWGIIGDDGGGGDIIRQR